jgi:hypothetical protein
MIDYSTKRWMVSKKSAFNSHRHDHKQSNHTFPTFGNPTMAVCNFIERLVEEYDRCPLF